MLANIVKTQKKVVDNINNPLKSDLNFRIHLLKNLKKAILKYESEIISSIKKDLNRSEFSTYSAEIYPVISEIDYIIKNLKKFAKPQKAKTPTLFLGAKSSIIKNPYGVVLIICPWNYPFLLAFSPLIGALSAGNCAIVKPSEYSPFTSCIIKKIINEVIPPKYVQVVLGDYNVVNNIISMGIDLIFFTGSSKVGKIIMEKAVANLTPVILELGGKSPCIIDKTANIDTCVKNIVWGKTLNSGQTCVAPDYIIINENIKEEFINKVKYYIKKFYGKEPIKSEDYTKIINKDNFKRILKLIENENIIFGGKYDENELKIEPTLIYNPSLSSNIMKEEIFAPVLPILTYKSEEEIYKIISKNKNPLAMYIFTKDKKFANKMVRNIKFGGCGINTTILHISNHNLPFGGVGNSGMGKYHGKYSFETFSHTSGVLDYTYAFDSNIKYKPFENLKKFKKIIKFLNL